MRVCVRKKRLCKRTFLSASAAVFHSHLTLYEGKALKRAKRAKRAAAVGKSKRNRGGNRGGNRRANRRGNRVIVNRQWAITILATRALSAAAGDAARAAAYVFVALEKLLLLLLLLPTEKLKISAAEQKKNRNDATQRVKPKAAQRSAVRQSSAVIVVAVAAAATAERSAEKFQPDTDTQFSTVGFPSSYSFTRLFRFSSSFFFCHLIFPRTVCVCVRGKPNTIF